MADQSFDGLPQFNPSSGNAPLQGPPPALPGCDPLFPYNPAGNPPQTYPCTIDSNSPSLSSFHLQSMCLENPSPSWNESHVDWSLNDNTGLNSAQLNGFVKTAANDARRIVPAMMDTNGLRAMGYYDGNDLNYYYYMASQFATSDRWFSPAMSRTQINRMYLPAPGDFAQPTDLLPGDVCTVSTGPISSFNYTGYRVPLIVVSPFSKKNYVSHKNADLTAMLKLVETRFAIPSLTLRDAGQIDMSSEFFHFVNVPWAIPPAPPAQHRGSQCTLNPPTP